MNTHFRVRNFEKYQHYTDRRPPWIKLYRDLWDDPRFFKLNEADRYLLIGLLVIASQNENKVLANQDWLKSKLLTRRLIPLDALVAEGWLEWVAQEASAHDPPIDSDMLAECKPSRARGETEVQKYRSTETETYAPHGEFGKCLLTSEQFGKLQSRLNGNCQAYIDRYDRWADENPKKTANRKPYNTILNWFDRDLKEGKVKSRQQHPSKANPTTEELDALALKAFGKVRSPGEK